MPTWSCVVGWYSVYMVGLILILSRGQADGSRPEADDFYVFLDSVSMGLLGGICASAGFVDGVG